MDQIHLEIVDHLFRGAVSSVFSKRWATVNNRYLECFDKNEATKFCVVVPANKLYVDFCKNIKFIVSISWIVNIELNSNLKIANSWEYCIVLEVDFHYPDPLHNMRRVSIGTNTEKNDGKTLFNNQLGLLDNAGIRGVITPKLVQLYYRRKINSFIALNRSSTSTSVSS